MSFDAHVMERILTPESSPTEGSSRDDPSGGASEGGAEGPTDPKEKLAVVRQGLEEGSGEIAGRLSTPLDREKRMTSGNRQATHAEDRRGRFARTDTRRPGEPPDLALAATAREAAAHRIEREGDDAIVVRPSDLRHKVRTKKTGASIVFCVDASGSMGATTRMEAAKTAILDLLVDAYQRRDRVGLVSFRGSDADVVLAPTASVELARLKLETLPTGGSTPLAHGIRESLGVLESETRRDPETVPWMVLVTDGRANVGLEGGLGSEDARSWAARAKAAGVNTVILDTDSGDSPVAVSRDLARLAGGEYVRLGDVSGRAVARAVRERVVV